MTSWRILTGDVRENLRELPDQSVQCCVTSPPYFGLRDYGTAKWEGGDEACDHAPRAQVAGSKTATSAGQLRDKPSMACRCGARRIDSQIGLESTPEQFVASMVSVFAEVGRVLKDDGTLWLNLGDSYAGSGKGGNPDAGKQATNRGSQSVGVLYGKTGESARMAAVTNITRKTHEIGCKQKDLIGIPWMVAFALRSAGWYLRCDVIWSKPNPMPESVTDRPTKAHEYLFLLSKSRAYYYDAAAIREPYTQESIDVYLNGGGGQKQRPYRGQATKDYDTARAQNPSDTKRRVCESMMERDGRNCRSVWTFATQAYPGAHFATYPEELPTRCILAGSRPGDLILDPFTGSGTTGAVALKLGRSFIGCELNPAYVALAQKRIGNAAPLFSQEIA